MNQTILRRPPVLGIMILLLLVFEKFLAHTYTVITIYVLPAPWKFWVPGVIGALGVVLIIRGLGRDEVKGSILGYLGAVLIWMSWFESGLPLLAAANNIAPVLPESGNMMAGLLGEHVLLQASGAFCLMALLFMLLNKDIRCRMLLWLRRRLRLTASVGPTTQGYRPNVARVAATEYFFVTWFMYVMTLIIVDPRINGLYHPVTYALSALIALWGVYLVWKLTAQKEAGMALRYGIGAVGVLWFVPEILALYELLYEFYLYANRHPIAMSLVLVGYVAILVFLWKTPVDPRTGRAMMRQAASSPDAEPQPA